MRGFIKIFAALILLAISVSCTSDDSSGHSSQGPQLMVEAYVYANEAVDHVKIARIHDDGDADLIPVNDANVKISQGNVSVTLVLKDDTEGIYAITDPAMVFSGPAAIMLEIIHEGKTYIASTKFPTAITDLTISKDYINITESVNDKIPLATLTWNGQEDSQMYCIFSRGVEADSTNTYPIQPSTDSPLFSLHDENSVDLFPDHFTHIGSYQLYVSAVNEEFIRMYTQNSAPDLRGAPSNIEGAWGVFTAFNGQSVDITVD